MPAGIGYGDKMAMANKSDDAEKAGMPLGVDEMKAKKAQEDAEKGKMPPAFLQNLKDKKDDEEEKSSKSLSGVTEEQLRKSLDNIEEHIAKSGAGRQQELLSKAMAGQASDEERAELAGLLGGSEPTLGAEMIKSLDPVENESIAKSIDASEYLDQLHDGLMAYCKELGDTVQKSQGQQDEFNVILAKGLLNIGRAVEGLIKSVPEAIGEMSKSVTDLGSVPVGRPRAAGVPGSNPQAMQKSFGGQPPAEQAMNKNQVLDVLEEMHKSALQNGEGRALCGERLDEAITKFEQLSQMSPALKQEMLQFRASRMNRTADVRW